MSISSMTGFASTAGERDGLTWRWDVKSVNARGLDLRFRLPAGWENLEPKLRTAAQSRLTRGSVTIALSFKTQSVVGKFSIDDSALEAAVMSLATVRERLEDAGISTVAIGGEQLMAVPGVLRMDDAAPTAAAAETEGDILSGFNAALASLVAERDGEGKRLESIISEQVAQIESLTRDAGACADEAVQVLRARARTQIETVLADTTIAPERLEQEVAVLAVKADVREEIDRLTAHVAAARDLLGTGEPVGRRLDFLTQEFNREANTLCSKSPTERLTRIGLDLKTVIDQLREQAANVE